MLLLLYETGKQLCTLPQIIIVRHNAREHVHVGGKPVKKLRVAFIVAILGSVVLTALWVELFVYMPAKSIEKRIEMEKKPALDAYRTQQKSEPRLK